MSAGIREHLRSNVVGYVGVFLALTATAWASVPRNSVRTVHIAKNAVKTGKIAPGHVRRSDLGRNAVNGAKVANDSLTGADINEATLDPSALPPGPEGPTGPVGPQGPPGQNGSPDSPQQVLDKLLTVDGMGSGLDADRLDGISAESFARTGSDTFRRFGQLPWSPNHCWMDLDPGGAPAAFVRDSFGFVHLRGLAVQELLCPPEFRQHIYTLPEGYRPAFTEAFGALTSTSSPTGVNVAPNGDIVARWNVQQRDWVSFSGITFRCAPSGVNGCP